MADDAFMYFPSQEKIIGETADKVMSALNAFELKSLTFGIENATSIGSATSGAGQGKTTFNPISITKQVDTASCALANSCALGTHQTEAIIELRRAGGGTGGQAGATFMKFYFKEVVVTKVEWSGAGGEENLEENIDFVYGAIKVEYQKQKIDGTMDTTKKVALWSIVKNTADYVVS